MTWRPVDLLVSWIGHVLWRRKWAETSLCRNRCISSYIPLISALEQLKISSDLLSDQSPLRHLKWSTVSLGTCIDSREKKVLQEENSSHLKSKKPSSHLCFFMGYACSEDRLITRELLLSAWNQGDVTLQAPVQITVCYHLSGLLSKMIFLVYIVQSAFSDMNFILFSPWLSQGK